MLIGWLVARRDIRRRLRDLQDAAACGNAGAEAFPSNGGRAFTPSLERAHHFAALSRAVVKLALPRTAFANRVDSDDALGECRGHAPRPEKAAKLKRLPLRLWARIVWPDLGLTRNGDMNWALTNSGQPAALTSQGFTSVMEVSPIKRASPWRGVCVVRSLLMRSSTSKSKENTSTLWTKAARFIWRCREALSLLTSLGRNLWPWKCVWPMGKKLHTSPADGSLSAVQSSIGLPAACDHATGGISEHPPEARPNLIEPPASRQGAATAGFLGASASSNSSRFAVARSPCRQSRLCLRTP